MDIKDVVVSSWKVHKLGKSKGISEVKEELIYYFFPATVYPFSH